YGDLKPERIDAREIAYVGRVLKDTMVDLRLYKNKIEDIIYAYKLEGTGGYDNIDDFVYVFENTNDAKIYGGEFQLSYRYNDNRVLLSYAHNHVKADGWYNPHRIEQSFPEENLSVLWSRHFTDGYSTAIEYHYIDSHRHLDGDKKGPADELLGPTKRLDIQFGKSFKFGSAKLKIIAGAENLMDEYIDYRLENTHDARYYVKLSGELR
ncbi:MAG: TonB-dependent receptor, partial [Proteobacteria bacterium]|nr:TonB-dependent receptor [Pseudomonadota bacterium]